MSKLNHSRHIDYFARDIGNAEYRKAKITPTKKQRRFLKFLYATCTEKDIEVVAGRALHTRSDYARAIDNLLKQMKEQGVDMENNNKDANLVLQIGTDRRGRDYAREYIHIDMDDSRTIKPEWSIFYDGENHGKYIDWQDAYNASMRVEVKDGVEPQVVFIGVRENMESEE